MSTCIPGHSFVSCIYTIILIFLNSLKTGKEVSNDTEHEKEIEKILHASTCLLWEEEYDASKEETISWNVPCAELIEELHLQQLEPDGFYFDSNGSLAAFDVNLTQNRDCIVVRKDLLDKFLALKGMELIWIMEGGKEVHASDRSVFTWSKWESLFAYEKEHIGENDWKIQ